MIKWLKAWWGYITGKVQKVTAPPSDAPATPPATTTPVAGTDTPATGTDEAAQGFAHPATVDCTMTMTGLSAKILRYTLTGCTWAVKDDCQGEFHYGRKINGSWKTQKIDHFRPGTSGSRDFKNITGGYHGATVPANGEIVAFFMVSYDQKHRSTACFGNWKGQ